MKKAIYTVVFILILGGTIAGIYLYKSGVYIASYQSPNGAYELVIQRRKLDVFIPTMPGDGSSYVVVVVLKSADGKVIGTCKSNSECAIFKDSINVDWDFENNHVFYAKARTINLKTGKVEC